MSEASEPGHDLVGDVHDAVLRADLAGATVVTVGWHDDAPLPP